MKFNCNYCGKAFDAKKETALYCSNSHRTLANKQRRKVEDANADIEKQRIAEQEQRQQIADDKQKKRVQKAESKRQEQENKRIQDEKDAAAVAEKNRKDEEDRQKLEEQQEADEKQRLADKLLKSIADRLKMDKERRDTERKSKVLGAFIFETVKKLSNQNKNPQSSSTKTDNLINQGSFPQSGKTSPPIHLNSTKTGLGDFLDMVDNIF